MTQNDPTLDYFEEYREKKRQLESIGEEYRRLRAVAEQTKNRAGKLEQELMSMKKIMTVMIEHGIDPVEAKLKNDVEALTDSLWDSNIYDDMETITISPAYSMMDLGGATGAIGSTGPAGVYASRPTIKYHGNDTRDVLTDLRLGNGLFGEK